MSGVPPESFQQRVAVIMRSKNSDWVIHQTLAGLFSQDCHNFELVVVDSGSTDRTLDIVGQYPCRLIQIEAENYYPGVVLNQTIEQVEAEIVVFLNSDAVPLIPSTLRRLLSAFDDPAVQAAFARQLPRPEADTWVQRDYAVSFPPQAPAPGWLPFSLPMAALRRSLWRQRPFYTDAWGSEDTEWGHWAKSQGYKVLYVPDALVMHSHNYTLRQLYGRRFIEGEADAFIYRGRDSILRLIERTLASFARDYLYALKERDWIDLFRIPARRAVYQWAYYKGHRLGEFRRDTGNPDIRVGQQTVLQRYEARK